MLIYQTFIGCSIKRGMSTEPLVDHRGQCILIDCSMWFPLKLFRCHIHESPKWLLRCHRNTRKRLGSDASNSEVAQEKMTIFVQKDIFRFHITVDDIVLMSIEIGRAHV